MAMPEAASAWQTAHGDPDNSGAVDVRTVRAINPIATVVVGDMEPGAGPVVAPDGTVYVGNARGVLMAFRPDGTPYWSRDIGGFQSIMSSPVLGSDGSVYLIGAATVRDHITDPPTTRHVLELHKFTVGGEWLWHTPIPGAADRDLVVSAPPNILRVQGEDVILLPTAAGFSVRLTALSGGSGQPLAHEAVSSIVPKVTGGASWDDIICLLAACFSVTIPIPPEQRLPAGLKRPFPAVAVYTPKDGGTPLIFMSDGLDDLMGLAFTGAGFEERFRIHDEDRTLISTPLAWPDGHAMISTLGDERAEVLYAGDGSSTIRAPGPLTYTAPTSLGGSRHALVHSDGGVTIMSGVTILAQISLPGQSIASAAASRNHLFVSTASALYTLDKQSMAQLAVFQWSNGGVSQPVIGPQGHVYAIAHGILYVFRPPNPLLGEDGRLPDAGTVPAVEPANP